MPGSAGFQPTRPHHAGPALAWKKDIRQRNQQVTFSSNSGATLAFRVDFVKNRVTH
jgi:hypothetical protein